MAKLRLNEKRVQLSFQREDDLRLHAFMVRKAYKCRWELPTFILAALQDAFGAEMDNEEVDAVAEEALAKVRERSRTLELTDAEAKKISLPGERVESGTFEWQPDKPLKDSRVEPPPIPTVKPAMTPDDAYEQAVKQVQALNAEPMKKKTPVRGKTAASPPPPVQ